MPQDSSIARDQWERYCYMRESGHLEYLNKSRVCENYFAGYPGLQWDPAVLAELRDQRRPGLTINKILSTLSNIMGEQVDLRTEIAFKARYGAPSGNADTLTKLFKHISEDNQLNWVRSEMFADGAITSRGYVDLRMDFDRNIAGDLKITNMNPRNVLPDPDASEYDPAAWNDVIVTKWFTPSAISYLYNKKDGEMLATRGVSSWDSTGYDSIDMMRDRFGGTNSILMLDSDPDPNVSRIVRVIDRQYRKLTKVQYFVQRRTGDRKRIPASWKKEQIEAVLKAGQGNIVVDTVTAMRIRWTVTADDIVLHDEWSPYEHFTIVPYFPYFRYGRTIGLVENLIDAQDLLNKSTSQELHVINTTANSGWKIRTGALKNMTIDELEAYGARTGLVMELDKPEDAEKIQPNQIPQGLDRLSMKAEGFIKSVSARGDAQMGMTRADASADQIEANNQFGDKGLAKPLDNLARTDHIIARNALCYIQEYYSDPRTLLITHNDLTGEQTEITINWPDPETGEVMNDLTMGEYDVSIITQRAKATLEDSQFEQGAYMREKLGIPIPDEFLIENSRLINKTGIIKGINEAKQGPEAQAKQELAMTQAKLELANLKEEAARVNADALLKRAKTAETLAKTRTEAAGEPGAEAEIAMEERKHNDEMRRGQEKHAQEMQMKREKHAMDMELERAKGQEDVRRKRAEAIVAARRDPNAGAKGNKPQPQKGAKSA